MAAGTGTSFNIRPRLNMGVNPPECMKRPMFARPLDLGCAIHQA
jgi:hypothetical protein